MAVRANRPSGASNASRYPWFGSGLSRAQWVAALLAAPLGGGLAYIYVSYLQSGDVSPDSLYGYAFAIAGTLLLLLVGIGYALRKRLRRNWTGLLHTALAWHIVGGLLALMLILMHAAGNFHPRTGSYALYGLIALVMSGVIGRLLDRVSPRLAARAALRALTPEGEERLEALVGALDKKRFFRRERQRTVRRSGKGGAPWDLAYYDLDADTGEISALFSQLGRTRADPTQARQAPATSDSAEEGKVNGAMASESVAIRQAMGAERLFLHLVHVWRYLHTAISIVTLGLILWHLEYAATLLLGAR